MPAYNETAPSENSIVYRVQVLPGIDAVAYYEGPDFGYGYLTAEVWRLVDRVSSQHEAAREVDAMARYGRDYAHFPGGWR